VFELLPVITLQQFLNRSLAFIVVAAFQGVVAAVLLRARGDAGPWLDGRGRPGSVMHFDGFAYLSAVLTGFGWTRALDADVRHLKRPVLDALIILAVLVGAHALLSLALLGVRPLAIAVLPPAASVPASLLLATVADLSGKFALLALAPLPPLLGGLLLKGALTRHPEVLATISRPGLQAYISGALAAAFILGWPQAAARALGIVFARLF
jgi:hypothetical protein